jgi:hypothetical protein
MIGEVRRECWDRLDHEAVVPWLEGSRVFVAPRTEIGRCIFLSGLYEPTELAWLRTILRPGMAFVDVGANNGHIRYSPLVALVLKAA